MEDALFARPWTPILADDQNLDTSTEESDIEKEHKDGTILHETMRARTGSIILTATSGSVELSEVFSITEQDQSTPAEFHETTSHEQKNKCDIIFDVQRNNNIVNPDVTDNSSFLPHSLSPAGSLAGSIHPWTNQENLGDIWKVGSSSTASADAISSNSGLLPNEGLTNGWKIG